MPQRRSKSKTESLPKKWERLAAEHERDGYLLRTIVRKQLEAIEIMIDQGGSVRSSEIIALASSLVSAIKIEKEACSMDYLDSNRAISRVQQLGFLVQRPDGAIEIDATVIQD